ncbi:hypothetical protein B0H66DRAFT_619188 [Apodospora peruviana]|uniref:Xylanolytic transcriptional activator regulatory domain-containing protein n=1 Tax=Apodospora peruviana TaxID=516989 RepID=A0AAE0IC07_9PEZI|nr:hypothetical protein B0H66DRAFT_619188 [Apodospora peruviana]
MPMSHAHLNFLAVKVGENGRAFQAQLLVRPSSLICQELIPTSYYCTYLVIASQISPLSTQGMPSWSTSPLLSELLSFCKVDSLDSSVSLPFLSSEGQQWIGSRSKPSLRLKAAFTHPPVAPPAPLTPVPPSSPKISKVMALPPRQLVDKYAKSIGGSSRLSLAEEEAYMQQCQRLLPRIWDESATTEGLECVMICFAYHAMSGNLSYCELLFAGAVRLLFILEAHIRPPNLFGTMEGSPDDGDLASWADSHLRILFWTCFSVERMLLRPGQPSFILEDECDLDLPTWYPQNHGATRHQEEKGPQIMFHMDLRLCMIKGRVHSRLYSRRTRLHGLDADLLREIRQLDTELADWKANMPSYLQHHLEFYNCLAAIHRATTTSQLADNLGVKSSFALCVEASRLVLIHLDALGQVIRRQQHPEGEARSSMAFYLPRRLMPFYPLDALLTVFCQFIDAPTAGPDADRDLQLLRRAPEVVSTFCEGAELGSSNRDLAVLHDMHMIAEFVGGLCDMAEAVLAAAVDGG